MVANDSYIHEDYCSFGKQLCSGNDHHGSLVQDAKIQTALWCPRPLHGIFDCHGLNWHAAGLTSINSQLHTVWQGAVASLYFFSQSQPRSTFVSKKKYCISIDYAAKEKCCQRKSWINWAMYDYLLLQLCNAYKSQRTQLGMSATYRRHVGNVFKCP